MKNGEPYNVSDFNADLTDWQDSIKRIRPKK